MNDIAFDRLRDVSLREAWAHEALAFTPSSWLAANIEHISEAIGVPLELTGTEVAVGPFSADILARNPQDDSVVLIENQLEPTDHTHLGQIMTYLAGLEAKTVVWIAPHFREPHLSAIRWLNQHTADGFSFFALRLRVVRIGESPFAPIFEVVEKPSGWEREVRDVASGRNKWGGAREDYWSDFMALVPDLTFERRGKDLICFIGDEPLYVALFADSLNAGIWIYADGVQSQHDLDECLGDETILESRLGDKGEREGRISAYSRTTSKGLKHLERRSELLEWHVSRLRLYIDALMEAKGLTP